MNNLLTRTLFISLLLSAAVLPAVQDKKIKSNRWKEIEERAGIVGIGVLGGVAIGALGGIKIGAKVGRKAGEFIGAHAGLEVVHQLVPRMIVKEETLFKLMTIGSKAGAKIGDAEGAKIGELLGGLLGGLLGIRFSWYWDIVKEC